jgi:hypothetical protein
MNPAREYQSLGRKQVALQEGIQLMREAQRELQQARAKQDAWGVVAVVADATLIPLNCIVNALNLGTAKSVYQTLVRALYDKVGKSGARLDGHAKTALSLLRQAITEEIKRKGLTQYVPGVNILIGLSQDSLTAWQTMQTVSGGGRETDALARAAERQIAAAQRELMAIGVRRANLLDDAKARGRIA